MSLFSQSFILLISIVILLLPLMFWMYVFVNFFHFGVTRKMFLVGVGTGAIATLPIVYNKFFLLGDLLEELFFSLGFIATSFLGVDVFYNFFMLFVCLGLLFFFFQFLFQAHKEYFLRAYKFSSIGFIVLLFLFSLFIYIISYLSVQGSLGKTLEVGNFVYTGLGAIVGYYIVISLLEEGVKYFSGIGVFSFHSDFRFQRMICAAACVALGFSFFENILYFISYLQNSGINGGLLQLVFFRSIFTIILHITCSMLFVTAFWYVLKSTHIYIKTIGMFLFFSFLGIGSHVLFDVSLTFGYIGVVFFYVILLYIYLSYLMNAEG